MMHPLDEERKKINLIDEKLASLFSERMAAVERIAEIKKREGLPVKDPDRERELLCRTISAFPDAGLRPYYADFQKEMLKISKQYQSSRNAAEDQLIVRCARGCYPVTVRRGVLFHAGEQWNPEAKTLIVTDDGVPKAYVNALLSQCKKPYLLTLPSGEESKTISSLESVFRLLQKERFTRTDCVVALGGGKIGDLAGFAASSYLRGLDFYNIPTTLLADADASIGGKTAVNFGGVKNAVGAFYSPKAVLIDPDLLDTLPPREMASGYAEIIKMAMTSDAGLFEFLEKGNVEIDRLILSALSIKKRVVEADETESDLRKILNFGHTLGHGIEAAGKGRYTHGEAVALGMIPMTVPAVRNRLIALLQTYHLPTSFSLDMDEVLTFCKNDKKCDRDEIDTVSVEEIGSCRVRKTDFSEWAEGIRTAVKNDFLGESGI